MKSIKKNWPVLLSGALAFGITGFAFSYLLPEYKIMQEEKAEFARLEAELERKVKEKEQNTRTLESALEQEEIFLFNSIANVDFSRKTVSVDVFFEDVPINSSYLKNKDIIFRYIKEFYARQKINLDFNIVSRRTNFQLASTNRIYVEILGVDSWFSKNFEICDLRTKEEQLALTAAFLPKMNETQGYTKGSCSISKNIVTILSDELIENEIKFYSKSILEKKYCTSPFVENISGDKYNLANLTKAQTLAHELAHAFGLNESHEFINDPVEEIICNSCKIPNLMSYKALQFTNRSPLGAELTDFQKTIMHSYLSKGRVYEQYRLVNFDSDLWSRAIATVNGYVSPFSRF